MALWVKFGSQVHVTREKITVMEYVT